MNVNQLVHSQVCSKPMELNVKSRNEDKEKGMLKFWECDEPHLLRVCPHNRRSVQHIQVVHEATTVNDLIRNIPRISVTLEDTEEEHQSTMIEREGIIFKQLDSI